MHELQIYCAANKLPNNQRELFIEAACVKNPQLLQRVHALFEAKNHTTDQAPAPVSPSVGGGLITRIEQDVLIVYFADTRILEESRINEIGAGLVCLIQRFPGRKLLLNFKAVTCMSSTMLSKIIGLSKECRKAQIELRLCEISSGILQVFELMKLTTLLNIGKTERKSLAKFNPRTHWFGKRDQ